MDKESYATMIRSMHRAIGWAFILSIILSPIGILILRRGNRAYRNIMSSDYRWESGTADESLILSYDDFTSVDTDPDL